MWWEIGKGCSEQPVPFAQKGATMFKFLQCGSALQIEVVAMNSKSLVRQEKDEEEVARQFFDKWYSQGSG